MPTLRAAVRSIRERDALVEKWSGLVYYALRRLRHIPAVRRHEDDCHSAALLALLRAAELWREDGGAAFSTYALRSIRQRIFRELRSHRNDPSPVPLDNDQPLAPEGPDPLVAAGLRAEVLALIGVLPPRWGQVLRLHYGIGCAAHTLSEVGARLGFTQQRAAQIEARALKRLRRRLGRAA